MERQTVQIKTDSDRKTGIITCEIYADGELKVGFGIPMHLIPDVQKALTGEVIRMFVQPKEQSEIIKPTVGESIQLSKHN